MAPAMTDYDKVKETADAVLTKVGKPPAVAIVLGSGLGAFAARPAAPIVMPYDQLPHWPASGVVGHEGRLVVGTMQGRRVAVLSGRSHLYEGHELQTVVFGVRAMGLLGVKTLILTNGAGGVNSAFMQGALMVIDDHINLMGENPLAGRNDERFGVRFPDMTEVYSRRLRQVADQSARALGLDVVHGVYAALKGPSYETPAEIRYLRTIGADAVGMSTVPEAIAARHMGMEVLGISCITNMAAGMLPQPLNHDEVLASMHQVGGKFVSLLEGIVGRI